MAALQFKNGAKSTVANDPLASGGTTLNVAAGQGARFPAVGDFLITIWDKATYPDPSDDSNMEIVRATARSTDAITITRAREGTTGVEHALGSAAEMLITAGTHDEMLQSIKDSVSVSDTDQTHSVATDIDGSSITLVCPVDGVIWCSFCGWGGGQVDANGDLTVQLFIELGGVAQTIGGGTLAAYFNVRNETANGNYRVPVGFHVPINVSAGSNTVNLSGLVQTGTNFDIDGRFSAEFRAGQYT